MIRKLIIAATLVMAASQSYAVPVPQSPARVVIEVDTENLRASELYNLNRAVGERLREAPLIPVSERGPQSDAVVVRVANAADTQKAMDRLKALGDASQYAVTQRADGAIEIRFSSLHFEKLQAGALNASREAVQRRVLHSGVTDATVATQGNSRIVVQTTGLDRMAFQALVDTLTTSGLLTFNMVDTQANPAEYQIGVPRNNRVALPNDSMGGTPQVVMLDAIITGSDLSSARSEFDQFNRPAIAFQLHSSGAQKFGRVTSQNIGQPFAIVLDNRIVSAPVIQSAITGGSGQITGRFTVEEAQKLAVVLRSGALPVKLVLVERLAPQ